MRNSKLLRTLTLWAPTCVGVAGSRSRYDGVFIGSPVIAGLPPVPRLVFALHRRHVRNRGASTAVLIARIGPLTQAGDTGHHWLSGGTSNGAFSE
jgi:hypothetical protein